MNTNIKIGANIKQGRGIGAMGKTIFIRTRERLCPFMGTHTISIFILILFCSATLLVGCDGKEGGTTTTTTMPSGGSNVTASKLTGSVVAPGGTLGQPQEKGLLAKTASFFVSELVAQTPHTLQPVAGANLFVFQIDNAGKPVGAPIAKGKTNADGTYSVDLPANTPLSSRMAIQATMATSPTPVTQRGSLNSMAVRPVLDLDPVAQLATQAIIEQVVTAGAYGNLSNYTNAEVEAFYKLLWNFSRDPILVGATIPETTGNMRGKLKQEFRRWPSFGGLTH